MDPDSLPAGSVLDALDADARDRLMRSARRRTFRAGSDLVREGELTSDFFVILEGRAEVIRDGEVVAAIEPGGFVGEAGALDAGPGYAMARTATVRAAGDVVAAAIAGEAFTATVVAEPRFRAEIYDELARRESR